MMRASTLRTPQSELWVNCPFPLLSKEERLRTLSVAICKGCNSSRTINSNKYQLCSHCSHKYRYYGESCEVPNCESVADGSIRFSKKECKILCGACQSMWQNTLKSCAWDTFVEKRHLYLLRPPTFVKALAEGLVSPVENPVKHKEIAECSTCKRDMKIYNTEYQLCVTCLQKLQYLGEKCSIGGTESCPNEGQHFDTQESRFVCYPCTQAKNTYNLASFRFYETQIRTITVCMLCSKSVSHNKAEGAYHCSAHIDHDHDTGKIRGVLCNNCNMAEGHIAKMDCPIEWAKKLVDYLENPPLVQRLK